MSRAERPGRRTPHARPGGLIPDSMRRTEGAELQGTVHGECGDTMEIYLRLHGDAIDEATFMTDGGESIIACGDALTGMIRGKTPAQAALISPEELVAAVGGLLPAKVHCAKLAVRALRAAVGVGGPA